MKKEKGEKPCGMSRSLFLLSPLLAYAHQLRDLRMAFLLSAFSFLISHILPPNFKEIWHCRNRMFAQMDKNQYFCPSIGYCQHNEKDRNFWRTRP